MLTNSITTPKSLPTSQILATAALQVWSGLAVCMQNTEGKVDPKHHIDASAALLQVQSVCDLLGGHAKFKKRNNDIKTCTLATKALAANFVVLKECRHKKDPDKKLRPALTKAVESLDKRPKHMTEDDEDWSLEDKETKAFQAAFEKITNVADDIIMAHADLLNESSEKLFSLAVDKIEAQIRSLEPVAGGCSNGKIWPRPCPSFGLGQTVLPISTPGQHTNFRKSLESTQTGHLSPSRLPVSFALVHIQVLCPSTAVVPEKFPGPLGYPVGGNSPRPTANPWFCCGAGWPLPAPPKPLEGSLSPVRLPLAAARSQSELPQTCLKICIASTPTKRHDADR